MADEWWLYMLECQGGSIYIGIAKDVDARYAKHCAGCGAKYTKMYPPIRLLAAQPFDTHEGAARAEIAMKKLKPAEKWNWGRAIAAGLRFAAPQATD